MKLADWLHAQAGMTPSALQGLLGIKCRSTLHRYLTGERRPRKKTMERIKKLTRGKVAETDFDGKPPKCAVLVAVNGKTTVILPFSSRDARLDLAYRQSLNEPIEGDDLSTQAKRAILILGGRARYFGRDQFLLDGRPSDLRRVIRAANEILVERWLPPIEYPVAHPKPRPARTERHSWGLFGFRKRKTDDNGE